MGARERKSSSPTTSQTKTNDYERDIHQHHHQDRQFCYFNGDATRINHLSNHQTMSHDHLSNAKRAKNDEYYTRPSDVELELAHYTASFEGKVVYCNCDDQTSAFKDYYVDNFKELGLQGLFCSGIAGELFEYDGDKTTVSKIDGDFRSNDSTAIMQQSDIVVTNPPYSLFRPFFTQLLEHEKDFLILGNKNAVSCQSVFPAIKEGVVRLGYTAPDYFQTPKGELANLTGLSRWFTTLPTPGKNYPNFTASISDREYQQFDLYPALNVDRTCEIPTDYDGLLGVPISALDKLDQEKFELVDLIARYAVIDSSYDTPGHQLTEINGEPRYSRLIVRKLNLKDERRLPID